MAPSAAVSNRRAEMRGPNSRQRRKIRRALERARQRVDDIDETAGDRRVTLNSSDDTRNLTERQTRALDDLYEDFRGDRREIYDAARVPEGAAYRGNTSQVGSGSR